MHTRRNETIYTYRYYARGYIFIHKKGTNFPAHITLSRLSPVFYLFFKARYYTHTHTYHKILCITTKIYYVLYRNILNISYKSNIQNTRMHRVNYILRQTTLTFRPLQLSLKISITKRLNDFSIHPRNTKQIEEFPDILHTSIESP